jgi:hypothetical protein
MGSKFILGLCAASTAILAGWTTMAAAQSDSYDSLIARCNDGTLPRPERDACIRDAGLALQRAQQGSSGNSQTEDRSTVVTPYGSSREGTDSSTTYTSPDGRAVIVPPAGSAPPADAVTQ